MQWNSELIEKKTLDFQGDVVLGMKNAFKFNQAAINALNSLGGGGDMNGPTYRAQFDLLKYMFNKAIEKNPNTIDTSDSFYKRVENTFTRVKEFDKEGDGSASTRPQGDLPADDVIVYCNMDGVTELGKDASGRRKIRLPDTDIEVVFANTDKETEWDGCKPNSLGSTMVRRHHFPSPSRNI